MKPFMSVYKKRYDTSKGFGNPEEWNSAFNARMGLNKAKETIGGSDPYSILEVAVYATWSEIKTAYRKMVMKYHPDRNRDVDATKTFLKVQAAYEILEEKHGCN